MAMNRREAVALMLNAGIAGAFMGWVEPPFAAAHGMAGSQQDSLRSHAAAKGLLFGAALRKKQLLTDQSYASVAAQQCGILTPELELKWDMLRPTPDQFDFSGGDWLFEFAKSHAMQFRGHTLVWEGALPAWFAGTVNPKNAKNMLLDHIAKVVGHYAGKVHSWDVVNEGLWIADGRPDGLKNTPWLKMIGPEYIEMAFHATHEADPNAMLVYNENWLEPEDDASEQKRQAALVLLKNLKVRNVPVHGLGIQSHLFADATVPRPRLNRFLDEVSALGLSVLITELDIRDQRLHGDVPAREQIVAQKYFDYLSAVLQHKAVKAVLTWGLSDKYTWITRANPRADGSPVRPLLYGADMMPAPAWKAVAHALDQAPLR